MDIDFEELAIFVETLENTDFTHFLYEKGDVRIEVRRGGGDVPAMPASSPASASAPAAVVSDPPVPATAPAAAPASAAPSRVGAAPTEDDIVVAAPLLGTVYLAPKPGEARFVEVGATVAPESSLCIVEVMKLMNTVHAGTAGIVTAIHVTDGQLVEHGQPLFSIRADAAA